MSAMRKTPPAVSRLFRDERGLTLVESMIAMVLVGTALVAFATALSTGSLAVAESDTETAAQSLARSQMEYTKGYPYDPDATTYPTVTATDGYSIAVSVASVPDTDASIQKVTADVSKDGLAVLTVEDYKVDR